MSMNLMMDLDINLFIDTLIDDSVLFMKTEEKDQAHLTCQKMTMSNK